MITPVAYGLAVLVVVLISLIGLRFLLAPRAGAAGYGVPARDDGDPAYLAVKGLRDLALGLVGAVLLVFTNAQAVGWFMLASAIIPLGDAVIVLRYGGTRAVAFGIHLTTAVVLLVDAGLLLTR